MLDCLIIGDSIAQGVSHFEQQCSSYTEVGISPKKFIHKFSKKYSKTKSTTIISLGSNNPGSNSELNNNLTTVRKELKSQKIIWILPNDPKLKERVKNIADHFGDEYVEFEVGRDNIHPKNYKSLDVKLRRIIV